MKKAYYSTLDEIQSVHGFTREYSSKILRDAGVKKTARGYLRADVDAAIVDHKKKQLSGDGSLRDEKLLREIKILDIEIDELLGKTIELEKHKETVTTVQGLMLGWFDQIVEAIATKRKDAELLKELRAERDRISAALLDIA